MPKYLYFDSINYLSCPFNDASLAATQEITVEFWMKFVSTGHSSTSLFKRDPLKPTVEERPDLNLERYRLSNPKIQLNPALGIECHLGADSLFRTGIRAWTNSSQNQIWIHFAYTHSHKAGVASLYMNGRRNAHFDDHKRRNGVPTASRRLESMPEVPLLIHFCGKYHTQYRGRRPSSNGLRAYFGEIRFEYTTDAGGVWLDYGLSATTTATASGATRATYVMRFRPTSTVVARIKLTDDAGKVFEYTFTASPA